MLREGDVFFMWEGWAIFTKLLGCLVIRQKFNCNNMFSGFLPDYREVWRWSHKVWHLWSNLSCYWQEFSPWERYTSYGSNNNNFPPAISGLMPQKAPAYWYWCYGEMLWSNSLSPGVVGAVISGNGLGHFPFPCFTCCYNFLFLVANTHQIDCTLQRKSESFFTEGGNKGEGKAGACPASPSKSVAYSQISRPDSVTQLRRNASWQ